ncbi:hypothetical protein, partial [Paraburkholderia sp. SIMBA_030]
IHGTQDEAVDVGQAEHLHILNPNSELFLVENANHTFGAREPWIENQLPEHLKAVTEKCISFLNEKMK